ncbi:MAG: Ig-like domain-containing protein [Lentimicrobium sp.]
MKSLIFILLLNFFFVISSFGQNNPPVANTDSLEVMEQVPVLIDVKVNDYDPDGDQIIIHMVDPHFGEVDVVDEKILYRSDPGFSSDYLRYSIRDDQTPYMVSPYAIVKIALLPNPDIPVAVADTFELMKLLPHNLDLRVNDFDLNSDVMKIYEITSPENCTVQISGDSLSVNVVPGLAYSCKFSYRLKEAGTETNYISDRVTVRIYTIDNPDIPVISPDTAYSTGGIAVSIPVLDNDSDPQGDEIEISTITQASDGLVTINGDELTYLPDLSFTGTDQFQYNIRETADHSIYTDKTTVKVYVSKNPDCPVGVEDNASGTTAVPMTIDVLANDYDVNGDAFEIKDVSRGTITAENKILFQSLPTALGQDSIFYRVMETNNPLSFSEWTKVNIQLAVNPDLPVTVDDYLTTHAGIPIEIRPLINDIRNAEDTLILSFASNNTFVPRQGAVYTTDDVVNYVPAYQAGGSDEIRYFVKGNGGNSVLAVGKIYVTITEQPYYDSLQVNNINAGVHANGSLFSKFMHLPVPVISGLGDMEPHFRFPADAKTNTIFAGSAWVGGFDQSGELHFAGNRYTDEGFDFQAGPVSEDYDTTYYLKFGRIWKISKAEIEYHKQNYHQQGYQPVEAILSWPGNGNPALGQAEQLAPYADLNNDGIYNCMDGDYPLIRGDQTIFFMYNDDTPRPEGDTDPMEIEIHGMAYAFDAPSDTALFNTVFVHYDLINRSTNSYTDCHLGIFTDLDIGLATDDYIASDVTRGTYYGYNGKETDGNGQYFAYGDNPPAQSVTILAGPYKNDDGLDNPDGGCDESINGLNFGNNIIDDERLGLSIFSNFQRFDNGIPIEPPPLSEIQLFNYLKGIWSDFTPFMYGGNGHGETGTVGPECNFMYPGNSDPHNWGTDCEFPEGGYNQGTRFWTEEETRNNPGDRRGLGAIGPFSFSPGQVHEVEVAYCTGQGNSGPGSSVDQLLRNIDSLLFKVAHNGLIVPNNALSIKPDESIESFRIYPNPASTFITLQGIQMNQPFEYAIYSMVGTKVASGKWLPGAQTAIDIHNLTHGMYILKLTTGKSVLSGKFIRE